MSNEIMPFQFEGTAIRIEIDEAGNPWWVAADVCVVLGISNVSDAVGRLKSREKSTLAGIGKTEKDLIINESGLYRLIFRSNKAEAERFQDWVFNEVLPQIRKTGSYQIPGLSPRRQAIDMTKEMMELADLFKCPMHAALTEAVKAAETIGVDLHPFLQTSEYVITSDAADYWLEPTPFAERHGMSGAKFNKLLETMGLQAKVKGEWIPTDSAEGLYYYHQWKSTNSTKSGRNLKWHVQRVEQLMTQFFEVPERHKDW